MFQSNTPCALSSLFKAGRKAEGLSLALDTQEELTLKGLWKELSPEMHEWVFAHETDITIPLSRIHPDVLIALRSRNIGFFPYRDPTKFDEVRHLIFLYCKFIQHPDLMLALLSTRDSWLCRYSSSAGVVERWTHLENLRAEFLKMDVDKAKAIAVCFESIPLENPN